MALELKIASPCSESWDAMRGDERQRHCDRCRLNVYNVKELTEVEVRALLMKGEGRVCVRLYQRTDGTVLVKDCPTGVAKLRKRALAGLTMAATLVLAVVGFRMGKKSCATYANGTWFERVVSARVDYAKEELRSTRTFGPVIDELWPAPSRMLMGDVAVPPPVPAKGMP